MPVNLHHLESLTKLNTTHSFIEWNRFQSTGLFFLLLKTDSVFSFAIEIAKDFDRMSKNMRKANYEFVLQVEQKTLARVMLFTYAWLQLSTPESNISLSLFCYHNEKSELHFYYGVFVLNKYNKNVNFFRLHFWTGIRINLEPIDFVITSWTHSIRHLECLKCWARICTYLCTHIWMNLKRNCLNGSNALVKNSYEIVSCAQKILYFI